MKRAYLHFLNSKRTLSVTGVLLLAIAAFAQTPAASHAIGTVTAVSPNSITIKTDSGSELHVTVADNTKIVRTAPGQKTLQGATMIHLQDLQVGDRALVRGTAGSESSSIAASSLIIMKQGDVAQRQQEEMQEWQRHGTGGIVRSVDPATGAITVTTSPNQSATIATSANTEFLRYAPDSVKFSDAKKGTIADIHPGDQLRARGTRGADGQFTADAVISGSFRNIAGTVRSVDAQAGTVEVQDLKTKQPVMVKITPETQMRKIPQQVAQMIAMSLRRPSGAEGEHHEGAPAEAGAAPANAQRYGRAGANGGGRDVQQMIRRMPPATLADLQKGDAVMIVTTEGAAGDPVTALTLLSGVEPILTAAPTQASAANLLSGWSMGGAGEEDSQ